MLATRTAWAPAGCAVVRQACGSLGSRSRPMVQLSRSKYKDKRGTPVGSHRLVQRGKVSPMRPVPADIDRPRYAVSGVPPASHPPAELHDAVAADKLRASNALARDALAYAGDLVAPGVATEEIDAKVHDMLVRAGAYPSPLNYAGFPKAVCTSVNEVVCHGIPDDRELEDGDIISIDVSCFLNGYHGDNCRTFFVGTPDPAAEALVKFTKSTLDAAVEICGPGVEVRSIGQLIGDLCQEARYDSVREFLGHGIGQSFHTQPTVIHTYNASPFVLQVGNAFTIEPMITEGSARIHVLDDNWTAVTQDKGRAAQFEHCLLVTDHGVEVMTAYE